MRLKIFSALGVAAFAITTSSALADTVSYGPISFGSDAPFGNPTIFMDPTTPGSGSVYLNFFGLGRESYMQGPDGVMTYNSTTTFAFDVDPGYQITNVHFGVLLDGSGGEMATDKAGDVRISLSLCTSAGVCTYRDVTRDFGTGLPNLAPLVLAGDGMGVLQFAVETRDYNYISDGDPGDLSLTFAPVAPVPEPSNIALLGTGLLGGLGALRRRLAHA